MSLHYSIYKVQIRSFCVPFGSQRTFICYHILITLSRTFFKFFQSFLSCGCAPGSAPFITQLLYPITYHFICQELFQVFTNFFLCGIYWRRPRGQLAYISTAFPVCQALLYKNFGYFLLIFTRVQPSSISGFSTLKCRC